MLSSDAEWSTWGSHPEPHMMLKECPPVTRLVGLKATKLLPLEPENYAYWLTDVIPTDRSAFFKSLSTGGNGVDYDPPAFIAGPTRDVVESHPGDGSHQPPINLVYGSFNHEPDDLYVETYDGSQRPIEPAKAKELLPQQFDDLQKHSRKFKRALQEQSARKVAKKPPARNKKKKTDPDYESP